jgi:hypothetical protein
MTSFYSINVPSTTDIRQVATMLVSGHEAPLNVFWAARNRQVIICWRDACIVQPDALITESLAAVLSCMPSQIRAEELFLFEIPKHGKRMSDEDADAFYDCEWSDYASDRMIIQCNLFVDPPSPPSPPPPSLPVLEVGTMLPSDNLALPYTLRALIRRFC